jgi:hypothetical protein
MQNPLRLVFLCGCLEKGCDGVGDYTRLLAQACQDLGHRCCVISLHDPFVHHNALHPAVGVQGPLRSHTFRFKDALRHSPSKGHIQELLSRFDPHVISLQWVPYAFHPYGIPYTMGSFLKAIAPAGTPFHMMLHETWLQQSPAGGLLSSAYHSVLGTLQRQVLRRLMQSIRPFCIHTHTPWYAQLLQGLGYQAHLLPLFGSILRPASSLGASSQWLWSALQQKGLVIDAHCKERYYLCGLFGCLPKDWTGQDIQRCIHTVAQLAKAKSQKAVILHIGHLAASSGVWQSIQQAAHHHACAAFHLGPQTQNKVWSFLSQLDVGICNTPAHLVTKSASTAAMLDAGLPVLVTRWQKPHEVTQMPDPYLIPLPAGTHTVSLPAKRQPQSRLPHVAAQFMKAIYSALSIP